MDYFKFLDEQKELFLEHLIKTIPSEAYENSPLITQRDYVDAVYTDIMALGYNFGDINKAADDKMEMSSDLSFLGANKSSMGTVRNEIQETANLYPELVKIFSQAHLNYQSGKTAEATLTFIKEKLESLA